MRAHVRRRIAAVGCLAVAFSLLTTAPSTALPTWLPPETVSGPADGMTTSAPRLVVDRFGDATAVWQRSSGGTSLIQAATRPVGGSWGAPVTISDPARYSTSPDAVVDGFGTVTVGWQANAGATDQIEVARLPLGGTWSTPGFGAPALLGGPSLGVDDAGHVTAAWLQYRSPNYVVRTATTDPAGVWSVPIDLSNPAWSSTPPSVAVDRKTGYTAVVWHTFDGTFSRIESRRRAAGGAWSDREQVSEPMTNADNAPRVAVDDEGTTTVGYLKYAEGKGFFTAYASSAAAGQPWGTPVPLSALDKPVQDIGVQADGAGELVAYWIRYDGTNYVVQSASRPPGGAWSSPADLTDASVSAAGVVGAMAPDGTTYLAWHVLVSPTAGYLLQVSARPLGGTWTPPGTLAANSIPTNPYGAPAFDASGDGAIPFLTPWPTGVEVHVRALDRSGPTLQLAVPANGTAGTPVTMSATATDTWTGAASYAWSFGDGGSAAGASVTHTYDAPGSYTVSVTATDWVGNATTRTATITVAPPVPAIGTFKLTRNKIQALTRTVAKKTKLKVGLNTPSTVKLVFKSKHQHLVKGNHKRIRIVLRKTLPSGLSRITIRARLKGIRLKPDTYVITGTAKNATGKSAKKKVQLKVVRP